MIRLNKLILLVNLGSPEVLSISAIRKFLREFLSDKRVVGLPRILWYPILYLFILTFRVNKLFGKYKSIWHKSGLSPLDYYTRRQAEILQNSFDVSTKVDYAYSYGHSTVADKLSLLHEKYLIEELVVLPLYPQYSSTTTAAVFDSVNKFYKNKLYIPKLSLINSFCDNENYIQLLADSIRNHWAIYGMPDKLLMSFHSIPEKLVQNGDVYQKECEITFNKVCINLGVNNDFAIICYQSKFGKAKWIEPNILNVIDGFVDTPVKTIDVICPGFISDCLETLEEISIEDRKYFLDKCGGDLRYINCLNDTEEISHLLIDIAN